MNERTANDLLRESATLLVLDVPVGSEFGVDFNVYNVGPKFRGVKMIPEGLHFIYYSSVSKLDNTVAPRQGFFYHFKRREVVVKKWNKVNEEISDEQVSQEEKERFESNLRGSLDEFLAPYPYENYRKWIGLTDYISKDVVEALEPRSGRIASVAQYLPQKFPPDEVSSSSLSSKELPEMEMDENAVIRFMEIPKQKHPLGATPSEITKHNIDSTLVFEQIISRRPDINYILGEFQFVFVSFIVGQVLDAFERWKLLLRTFCTSDEALNKYSGLFTNFVRVLYFQLQEVPTDLFVDIVDKDNFLILNLYEFFSNVNSNEKVDRNLRERVNKFKCYITNKFKWDFETEPEDEAPVVVQM